MLLRLLITDIKIEYTGLSRWAQHNHEGPLNVEREAKNISVRVMQGEKDLIGY